MSHRNTLFRHLLHYTLWLAVCLTGCGGGSGSSPTPGPDPGPAIQNVLVYQDGIVDGRPMSLYLLNREGETRRLSEDTGGGTVEYHLVSPDEKRVAYWYAQSDSELVLVLLGLDSPLTSRTQVVNEGAFPAVAREEWLLWLPDSRRVLYSMAEPGGGYPTSLWLASEGEDSPVQLMAVAPGARAYLTYSASADGRWAAVAVNYLGTEACCIEESASLYLLDLENLGEPLLIDNASGNANGFQFAWSPAGHELLYQRWLHSGVDSTSSGPLLLLGGDGRSRSLREGDIEQGTRWLDAGRVLVALQTGFEVIATDGRLVASHVGTITGAGMGSGVESVVASPDGRWLGFVEWTAASDLEVYLLDLATSVTRIIGPASSLQIIWHNPIQLYDVSELHWSADGSWLAWDRQTRTPSEEWYVYAHSVSTAETRLVSKMAEFFDRGDYPWLPEGNVLEYRLRVTESERLTYALVAEDLDSGQTLFAEPYPMPALSVADPDSGEPVTEMPANICERTWLGNMEILWNGCDTNVYLSRIAGETLSDTRLIAQGTTPRFLTSSNHEIFLLSPAYVDGKYQMYDRPLDRLLKLEQTTDISSWLYTLLM